MDRNRSNYTKSKYLIYLLFFLTASISLEAQTDSSVQEINSRTNTYANKFAGDTADQRDLLDVVAKIFKPKHFTRSKLEPGNASFIILPGAYYSIPTGMAVTLNTSVVYYSSDYPLQNLSTLFASGSLTTKNQKTFSLYSNLYTKKNSFYFQGVGWFYDYSENTYGLGGSSMDNAENSLRYKYLRFYESFLKQVYLDVYFGIGYKLDYHYDIVESGNKDGSISDFKKFYNTPRTLSSGVSIDFMFDDRRNQINPRRGTFVNIVYSPKLTSFGSDNNWQSLKVDLRKYFKLSPNSNNLLAFWSLNQFTFGNAPYLDMPSTGWDDMQRSARGYAQARYRGKDMLYFEGEYRFKVTHNGVLGGVVFANASTFSTPWEDKFQSILPAGGAGLRIKLNKYTRTNLCIDYGIGIHGASGVFVNIGEIF